MFTGIVTATGRVETLENGAVCRATISSPYEAASLKLGCSIAHAGACLTIVSGVQVGDRSHHVVEISPETLAKTTLSDWNIGTQINLERALKIGDELGGHLVSGHVDGLGRVQSRDDHDGWMTLGISAPDALAPFIAQKGSIAVDGVSLTINDVDGNDFELMIIPHTADVTTLGQLQPGANVNLEVDQMARYAARLAQFGAAQTETRS